MYSVYDLCSTEGDTYRGLSHVVVSFVPSLAILTDGSCATSVAQVSQHPITSFAGSNKRSVNDLWLCHELPLMNRPLSGEPFGAI
jgi:hypothetical protein